MSPPVGTRTAQGPGWGLIFDPGLVDDPGPQLLDAARWDPQRVGRSARGRGSVLFVAAPGGEWALRHYRRGGLFGRLVEDSYLWLGAERTRSWREWRMLQRLAAQGLPVPRPVAAGFSRRVLSYTADIATLRIPAAEPLSGRLRADGPAAQPWADIGRTIGRFHRAGACHADLNAHNILLDGDGHAWLIDFDRGRFRRPGRWQRANLERLERSLRKIAGEDGAPAFDAAGWAQLLAGYGGGG